ncbi:hypothetical protein FB561_4166 [Kribbella amoyensis]|uniref:Uncharacterized protein n=1 Tax=Kribbella amoyensis TaxID=996641 RepID=A0A561BVT9_9ACTN|nr:hypothetical protein [Kribbella amoyensis]TWD83015.1 hypothetical protein FB561_4166 [Kribbella amoyensis]
MNRWRLNLGAPTLALAIAGAVVLADTLAQRDVARDFLSTGRPATAYEVELKFSDGKGGLYIDRVDVVLRSAAGELVHADLKEFLGDAEGAKDGRQPPKPGTRYAPPLPILYQQDEPTEVIAVVDANDLAKPGGVLIVAGVMLSVGLLSFTVVVWYALRPTRGRRRH